MSKDVESMELSLKKEVGLLSGIGLIVGTIIGSGIFVSPGGVLRQSGSSLASLLVWAACGLLSALGGLSYVELGTMIPESGAEYAYIHRGLGPLCAFINSWMAVLVLEPSSAAIICQTFAFYTVRMFVDNGDQDIKLYQAIVAVAALALICLINCLSVRLTTLIQNGLAFAKLVAVAMIIVGGVYALLTGRTTSNLEAGFEPIPETNANMGSLAMAFYSGLWSYEAWNQLNFVTEELHKPNKNLPRAVIIGVGMVSVLYLLINLSYLIVIPSSELISEETVVAVSFVRHLFPDDSMLSHISPYVMTSFVAMSTFGAANGILFASSRLSFAAGRNGHLPECLSYVHNTRLTPMVSVVFISLIAILMAFFSDIESLIDFFSITAWIFYGGAFLSLIILRFTAKQVHRPFRIWIVVPILATLFSLYLVVAPIVNNLGNNSSIMSYLIVLGFLSSGVLAYFLFVVLKLTLPGLTRFNEILRHVGNMSHAHKEDFILDHHTT